VRCPGQERLSSRRSVLAQLQPAMKLKRFLLRYYPPGIILEYELRDRTREMKEIDLLNLTSETDVDVLVNQIVREEPLVSDSRKPQLRRLIYKLIEKLETNESSDFYLFKILRAHILPLTNCAFNKSGDKFITGSYDRTCKVRIFTCSCTCGAKEPGTDQDSFDQCRSGTRLLEMNF
jgi:hypothetical protein